MSRHKDSNGLTHQQELFCQYVVDAYGCDTKGILVAAYRKAYNCKSDAQASTHWVKASQLAAKDKVRTRIEQLREERARTATISRDELITQDINILKLDPLLLWIQDEKSGNWRMRYIHEIPQHIRVLLKFTRNGKRLIPDVDKDAARKRLIEVLGYAKAKDININNRSITNGVLRIGFDDDE